MWRFALQQNQPALLPALHAGLTQPDMCCGPQGMSLWTVQPCRHVTFTNQEWEIPPLRFEAGTAPMGEAVALAAACVYLSSIGMTDIADHSAEQAAYVYREVSAAVHWGGDCNSTLSTSAWWEKAHMLEGQQRRAGSIAVCRGRSAALAAAPCVGYMVGWAGGAPTLLITSASLYPEQASCRWGCTEHHCSSYVKHDASCIKYSAEGC